VTADEFDTIQRVAKAMVASGYFQDARDVAQAAIKIMAGSEMGLPPFAAMTNIHIIQGRPALGANLIATLIKNDPRYDYRVERMEDAVCSIAFYEAGQKVGVSTFTAADAKKAGTKNMDRFPRNMLFARAISNGARWYTPGIFGGAAVYTPEELGAQVDEEGYVIPGEIVQPEPEPAPEPPPAQLPAGNGNGKQQPRASVEDARAWLDEQRPGNKVMADVARAAAMTDGYTRDSAMAKMPDYPPMPTGVEVSSGKRITDKTALSLFDWLVGQTTADVLYTDPVQMLDDLDATQAAVSPEGQ
jgi:hypothetical protein